MHRFCFERARNWCFDFCYLSGLLWFSCGNRAANWCGVCCGSVAFAGTGARTSAGVCCRSVAFAGTGARRCLLLFSCHRQNWCLDFCWPLLQFSCLHGNWCLDFCWPLLQFSCLHRVSWCVERCLQFSCRAARWFPVVGSGA